MDHQKPILVSLGAKDSPDPDCYLIEMAHLIPLLTIAHAILGKHYRAKKLLGEFFDFHVKNFLTLGYKLYKYPTLIPKHILEELVNLLDSTPLGNPAWALFAFDKYQTQRLLEDLQTFEQFLKEKQTLPQIIETFLIHFPYYKNPGSHFRTDHRSKTNLYKNDNTINSKYKALLVNHEWQQTKQVFEKLIHLHGISQGTSEEKEKPNGSYDWGSHGHPRQAHAHTLMRNLTNQAHVKKDVWQEIANLYQQKSLTSFLPFAPLLIATIWTTNDDESPRVNEMRKPLAPPSLNTLASLLGFSANSTTWMDMVASQINLDDLKWETLDLHIKSLAVDTEKEISQTQAPSPFRMTNYGPKRLIGKFLLQTKKNQLTTKQLIKENQFQQITPVHWRSYKKSLGSSTVLRQKDARSQHQKDVNQVQKAQRRLESYFSPSAKKKEEGLAAESTSLNPETTPRKASIQTESQTNPRYWPILDQPERLHDVLYVISKEKETPKEEANEEITVTKLCDLINPQLKSDSKDQFEVQKTSIHIQLQKAMREHLQIDFKKDPNEELKRATNLRKLLYQFTKLSNERAFKLIKDFEHSLRTHLGQKEFLTLTVLHIEKGFALKDFDMPEKNSPRLPKEARRVMEAIAYLEKQKRTWYDEYNNSLPKFAKKKTDYWNFEGILTEYRKDIINIIPLILYYKWLHQNFPPKQKKLLRLNPAVAFHPQQDGKLKASGQKMSLDLMEIEEATLHTLNLMNASPEIYDDVTLFFNADTPDLTQIQNPENLTEFLLTLETKTLGITKIPNNKRPPRWWNRMRSKNERTLANFCNNGDQSTETYIKEKRSSQRKIFVKWLRAQRKKLKTYFSSEYEEMLLKYEPNQFATQID